MTTKYATLAFAVLALRLLTILSFDSLQFFPGETYPVPRSFFQDPESLLALQQRIPFSQTGIYELELIPRISDKLAFNIDDKHERIMQRATALPTRKRDTAFEIVHGVGPKTAAKIAQYIDVGG